MKFFPFTQKFFAPFGDVIDTQSSQQQSTINQGQAKRYEDLAKLELDEAGRVGVGIMQAVSPAFPFNVRLMERHPLGSQVFVPMEQQSFLICVAPAESEPEEENLHLFLAQNGQGVHYKRNVWHHPLFSLVKDSKFLVLDRLGPGENLEFYYLKKPVLWHSIDAIKNI